MLQKSNFLIIMICVLSTPVKSLPMEPVCSKFDYEYKTLEAMLRVERYVEDMKKEFEKIQDDVTKKLREIEEFKQNQERDFTAMKDTIEEKAVVKSEPVDYGKPVPAIAFSAGNPTRKTGYRGVLLFSIVTTNVGGAYDKMTGLFTCPMDGVYMFVLTTAVTPSNVESYCRIQLNHRNVVISRAYYNQYSTFSNTVFLQLTKGDVVGPGDCYSIGNLYTDHSASSFSGALISKT